MILKIYPFLYSTHKNEKCLIKFKKQKMREKNGEKLFHFIKTKKKWENLFALFVRKSFPFFMFILKYFLFVFMIFCVPIEAFVCK